MIALQIPGKPIPYKAPRVYSCSTFNPRQEEKDEVQRILRLQYNEKLLTSITRVEYIFRFPIPISFNKGKTAEAMKGDMPHVSRPDTSNCIKFYEDCLVGVVLEDDSMVHTIFARKLYGNTPGTTILIEF